MQQTTILSAGTTAATSTDVDVAAGAIVNIGVFSPTTFTVRGVLATLMMDTPGGDVAIRQLTDEVPAVAVSGPGTYRVVRGPTSVPVGAYSET